MKKSFFKAYKALYHCSAWKAWKAWKASDEGLKIAIIEAI